MNETTDHLNKWLDDKTQASYSIEGTEEEDRYGCQDHGDEIAPPRVLNNS
jgi:hypothetical protein